jgi:hypothetical protein
MHSSGNVPAGASTVCVFGVPGVRTAVEDTDDGLDVTLAVVGDVKELRKRVRDTLAGVGPYKLSPDGQKLANELHFTFIDRPSGLTVHAVPIDPHADRTRLCYAVRERVESATSMMCD